MYSLQTLPVHLAQAQNLKNLKQILTTYDFLQSKVDLIGITSLITDYSLTNDESLNLIKNALRLSAHVLARKPTLLAGQLLGRLLNENSPDILSLTEQAKAFRGDPWLRPVSASLETVQGPLINTFSHNATVRVVTFTPDARRVISASSDHTIKVWDVGFGQELFSFNGHTDAVYALAVSSDGTWLASGSNDTTVQLWSLETGRRIGDILAGHQQYVKGVAISRSGNRVVSMSADRSIVWDVKERRILFERAGYSGYHAPAIFLNNDDKIILPAEDHSLLLWNTKTGEETPWTAGGKQLGRVMSISRSTDGSQVASSSEDGKIYIWDVRQARVVASFGEEPYTVNQVVFLPDGKRLLAVSDNNLITLWNLENQQVLGNLRESLEGIKTLAISADGRFAATGSSDHKILLWDLPKLEKAMAAPTHNRSPVNQLWAIGTNVISQNALGDITIWDAEHGHKVNEFSGFSFIGDLGGGKLLLWQTKGGELQVYDTTQGTIIDQLPGRSPAVATKDGRVISAMENGGLQVFNIKNRSIRHTLCNNTFEVSGLALDRSEQFLLAILQNTRKPQAKWGMVWKIASCQELGRVQFSEDWLAVFCLSTDGQHAIFGGRDGRLIICKIYDPKRPWYQRVFQHQKRLHAHKGEITGIMMSQDDDVIITAANDHSIKTWSLRQGKSLHKIEKIEGSQGAIPEDGEKAIVFRDDLEENIEVWDLQRGRSLSNYRDDHLPKLALVRNRDGSETTQPTRFFIIDQFMHMSKGAFIPNFSLSVRNLDTGKQFVSFEGDSLWTTVAVTNDGNRIIAGDQAGRVHFLDLIL
jgi:WD40 repeat protein